MRSYQQKEKCETQIRNVFCNQCGKKLLVEDGILKEGCFHVDHVFDYFSNKDGCIYSLDLCEACFDGWIRSFKHPVQIKETKEFL